MIIIEALKENSKGENMDIQKLQQILSNRKRTMLGSERYSKFAVLVPIVEMNNELNILLEVRSYQLRRQPGEICFPGGKIDQTDRDEQHTAIRETSEELGVLEKDIIHVSPLDYMVNPFDAIIYPYVGTIKDPSRITPNPAEVAEVFTIPLSHLKNMKPETYKINFKVEPEENFPFDQIIGGEKYKWRPRILDEHFYFYEGKVIWGLTARILSHFIELIKK